MSARPREAKSVMLVIGLTLLLSALLARIPPPPRLADAVARLSNDLGLVGVENVEDFYFALVTSAALVIAILIVTLCDRAWRKAR